MKVFVKTDIGKARDMNQDFFYVSDSSKEPKLYILADGMGGYAGGEIASKMAVESVNEYITKNWHTVSKNEDEILGLLKKATQYANRLIYEKSKKIQELKEMGTTLDVCLVQNDILHISHIGDSRIYLITRDYIKRITKDHTYVEQLLMDGTITKEEAESHPDRHMLLKALGCKENVEPDIFSKKWDVEEGVLLCSDGLTNMLKEEEIQDIVVNDLVSPDKSLINKANDFGGLDNITIILIKR